MRPPKPSRSRSSIQEIGMWTVVIERERTRKWAIKMWYARGGMAPGSARQAVQPAIVAAWAGWGGCRAWTVINPRCACAARYCLVSSAICTTKMKIFVYFFLKALRYCNRDPAPLALYSYLSSCTSAIYFQLRIRDLYSGLCIAKHARARANAHESLRWGWQCNTTESWAAQRFWKWSGKFVTVCHSSKSVLHIGLAPRLYIYSAMNLDHTLCAERPSNCGACARRSSTAESLRRCARLEKVVRRSPDHPGLLRRPCDCARVETVCFG